MNSLCLKRGDSWRWFRSPQVNSELPVTTLGVTMKLKTYIWRGNIQGERSSSKNGFCIRLVDKQTESSYTFEFGGRKWQNLLLRCPLHPKKSASANFSAAVPETSLKGQLLTMYDGGSRKKSGSCLFYQQLSRNTLPLSLFSAVVAAHNGLCLGTPLLRCVLNQPLLRATRRTWLAAPPTRSGVQYTCCGPGAAQGGDKSNGRAQPRHGTLIEGSAAYICWVMARFNSSGPLKSPFSPSRIRVCEEVGWLVVFW